MNKTWHIPEAPTPKFSPGFVIVPKAVREKIPEIWASGLAVYVAIAGHADNDTGKSIVGVRKIAAESALDPKTVTAAVERLEAAGCITTKKKSRRLTIYWV
jgi:predicted transcriptional regulator